MLTSKLPCQQTHKWWLTYKKLQPERALLPYILLLWLLYQSKFLSLCLWVKAGRFYSETLPNLCYTKLQYWSNYYYDYILINPRAQPVSRSSLAALSSTELRNKSPGGEVRFYSSRAVLLTFIFEFPIFFMPTFCLFKIQFHIFGQLWHLSGPSIHYVTTFSPNKCLHNIWMFPWQINGLR